MKQLGLEASGEHDFPRSRTSVKADLVLTATFESQSESVTSCHQNVTELLFIFVEEAARGLCPPAWMISFPNQ